MLMMVRSVSTVKGYPGMTATLLESTIITLADWYHDQAPDAQKGFFETGKVP